MRSAVIVACAVLTAVACRAGGPSTDTPVPSTTAAAPATATATPPTEVTPAAPRSAITAANVGTLQPVASFNAAAVQRLVWANDGALWLVGTRSVDTVDATTGAETRVFQTATSERVLGVSPAGVVATTSVAASPVRLVSLATGQLLRSLDPGGVTNAATFFKGNRVALVSADRIEVTLWDVGGGQQVGTLSGFQTAAPVYNVAISNDGARVAWVARGTLQFSEVASGVFGARVQFEDFIGAYAFSPDVRTFATATAVQVGGALQGRVQLWDPVTGVEVLRIAPPAPPSTLAYSNAQPLLATGGEGFALWSTVDGRQLAAVPQATAGRVRLVSFSPDGTMLATVADDGTVRFWRPAP